jgi:TetR/AcrR family tetracycline transcriptional repressor
VSRPTAPLISKVQTLEAALSIIDREGIDALSMRRLADELNVHPTSLYHHFPSKQHIVVGVVKLVLDQVRTPTRTRSTWQRWLVRNGERVRVILVQHPELIPLMMQRQELGIGAKEVELTTAMLEEQGVPSVAVGPVVEFGELLAIVSAEMQLRADSEQVLATNPNLQRAVRERGVSPRRLYELAFVAGVEAIIAGSQPASAR